MVACLVSVSGAHTAIHWSAPGTTFPAQSSLQQTYMTNVPNNGRLQVLLRVENRVCNGTQCSTVNIDLNIRPRYSTQTEWESPFFSNFHRAWRISEIDSDGTSHTSCVAPGETYLLEVEAFVANGSLPSQVQADIANGFVQFFVDGSPLGAPVPVTIDTSEGIHYSWWTTFGAPGGSIAVSAEFLGTTNLNNSFTEIVTLPSCLTTPVHQKPDDGSEFFWTETNSVELSWNGVAGASGYEVAIRSIGGGTAVFVEQTLAGTNYTFVAPHPGRYLWRVRAFGPGPSLSNWSSEWEVRFLAPPMEIELFDAFILNEGCPAPLSSCIAIQWQVTGDPFGTIEITRAPGDLTLHESSNLSGTIYHGPLPEIFCYTFTITATNSEGQFDTASDEEGNFCGPD
jgi:hypothetical protein